MIDTLLITGCGGDIALSIARIVREDGLASRIVGADVRDDHAGFAFYDEVIQLPRADSPLYREALAAANERLSPDVIVAMSEAELARLLAEDMIGTDQLPLLSANARALAIGLDKFATFNALSAANIATPRTGVIGETEPDRMPFLVKPRRGQGSKGIALVEEWSRDHVLATRVGDIWQQFLPEADEEYTCGLIRLPGAGTRSIALRRTLAGGLTGSAVVVRNPAIDAVLEQVADAVDLRGAINVQLRLHAGEPYVFEINPRFSSTVGFRHRLGFCDFQWSLEAKLGRPISAYQPVAPGYEIYRVGFEVIRPPSGAP